MSGWPWMKDLPAAGAVAVAREGEEEESNHTSTSSNANTSNNASSNIQGDVADEDDRDPRPIVQDLIDQHRTLLDEMMAQLLESQKEETQNDPSTDHKNINNNNNNNNDCESLFDPVRKHDDLWCLRFLLSHKFNVSKAVKAARHTLQFRRHHQLDTQDLRTTSCPPQNVTQLSSSSSSSSSRINKVLKKFLETAAGSNGGGGGGDGGIGSNPDHPIVYYDVQPSSSVVGVITYIDIGGIDTHGLARTMSLEDWIEALTFLNEYNFQWLDYMTRTTGRLTKSVRFVDVSRASLKQMDWTCQDLYTKAVAHMQDCYPQAVQSIYVCGAPTWIYVPWKAIKGLLPTRVVSKMDFLQPRQHTKDRDKLLQMVAGMDVERLPIQYGGTNQQMLGCMGDKDVEEKKEKQNEMSDNDKNEKVNEEYGVVE